MTKLYKTRAGGATVTVFVPYDCCNNCPFCINKEEYADMTGFSVEKICEAVRAAYHGTSYRAFDDIDTAPFGGERVVTTPEHFAYLQISEGCDNCCSYCAIFSSSRAISASILSNSRCSL